MREDMEQNHLFEQGYLGEIAENFVVLEFAVHISSLPWVRQH